MQISNKGGGNTKINGVPNLADTSLNNITQLQAALDALAYNVGVPIEIPAGETYIVETNRQALYAVPIIINGALIVNGILAQDNTGPSSGGGTTLPPPLQQYDVLMGDASLQWTSQRVLVCGNY